MAKIKLGNRPKNFTKTVKAPMLEGGEGSVGIQYIYRTRTEFGAFIDDLMASAGVKLNSHDEDDIQANLAHAMTLARDKNADYIMKVADGWDLDIDFTRANVVQMCDELPGIAIAIMETYRMACTEGRLGN